MCSGALTCASPAPLPTPDLHSKSSHASSSSREKSSLHKRQQHQQATPTSSLLSPCLAPPLGEAHEGGAHSGAAVSDSLDWVARGAAKPPLLLFPATPPHAQAKPQQHIAVWGACTPGTGKRQPEPPPCSGGEGKASSQGDTGVGRAGAGWHLKAGGPAARAAGLFAEAQGSERGERDRRGGVACREDSALEGSACSGSGLVLEEGFVQRGAAHCAQLAQGPLQKGACGGSTPNSGAVAAAVLATGIQGTEGCARPSSFEEGQSKGPRCAPGAGAAMDGGGTPVGQQPIWGECGMDALTPVRDLQHQQHQQQLQGPASLEQRPPEQGASLECQSCGSHAAACGACLPSAPPLPLHLSPPGTCASAHFQFQHTNPLADEPPSPCCQFACQPPGSAGIPTIGGCGMPAQDADQGGASPACLAVPGAPALSSTGGAVTTISWNVLFGDDGLASGQPTPMAPLRPLATSTPVQQQPLQQASPAAAPLPLAALGSAAAGGPGVAVTPAHAATRPTPEASSNTGVGHGALPGPVPRMQDLEGVCCTPAQQAVHGQPGGSAGSGGLEPHSAQASSASSHALTPSFATKYLIEDSEGEGEMGGAACCSEEGTARGAGEEGLLVHAAMQQHAMLPGAPQIPEAAPGATEEAQPEGAEPAQLVRAASHGAGGAPGTHADGAGRAPGATVGGEVEAGAAEDGRSALRAAAVDVPAADMAQAAEPPAPAAAAHGPGPLTPAPALSLPPPSSSSSSPAAVAAAWLGAPASDTCTPPMGSPILAPPCGAPEARPRDAQAGNTPSSPRAHQGAGAGGAHAGLATAAASSALGARVAHLLRANGGLEEQVGSMRLQLAAAEEEQQWLAAQLAEADSALTRTRVELRAAQAAAQASKAEAAVAATAAAAARQQAKGREGAPGQGEGRHVTAAADAARLVAEAEAQGRRAGLAEGAEERARLAEQVCVCVCVPVCACVCLCEYVGAGVHEYVCFRVRARKRSCVLGCACVYMCTCVHRCAWMGCAWMGVHVCICHGCAWMGVHVCICVRVSTGVPGWGVPGWGVPGCAIGCGCEHGCEGRWVGVKVHAV